MILRSSCIFIAKNRISSIETNILNFDTHYLLNIRISPTELPEKAFVKSTEYLTAGLLWAIRNISHLTYLKISIAFLFYISDAKNNLYHAVLFLKCSFATIKVFFLYHFCCRRNSIFVLPLPHQTWLLGL